ncbi:MAG TPA: hypothetical protein VFB62_26250 [Polyangiaceae bacterium]|nr:hypothetical protein [Polyangiaceae bacterium]
MAVGCGSEPSEQPPPEEEGVVSYTMTTTIAPGSEAEHCKFVIGPPEGLLINRDEVHYSQGSHHFILYDTNYEAIPDSMFGGTPFTWIDQAQGVFDCSEGVQFNLDVRQMIAGSQNSDGASTVHFPPGVAVRLRPNAVLLMNTHYINPSPNELKPEVELKLHTLREDELQMEGGILFFFNIFLKAPAMSASHATMTCDIPEAITISNAQSHMHARGVDYSAEIIDPNGGRNLFYENTQWENVPVQRYDPGLAVAAGSRIEHTCHWNNPGAEDVYIGPRSTDEMCVLLASYYPAKPELGLCSGRADEPYITNFMGAEWKGQGTATCNASLECFNSAIAGGTFDTLRNVTDCVLASDPAVAPELSDAIGCSISTYLVGGDVFTDCIDAYTACSSK